MSERRMAGYNQIALLMKISILDATNGPPGSSGVGIHVGIVVAVIEARGGDATNCAAPIAADDPNSVEQTIGAEPVARSGQF